MPGHKGCGFTGAEPYDITEIDGADVLYHSGGIIRKSEETASRIFGTARTVYSCEGSSLSIRAMMYLAVLYAKSIGRKPIIYAARNAHKVFLTASALLDFEIEWIYPESGGVVDCAVSPNMLDKKISEAVYKPAAVYITSPDYLGNIADIPAISAVCKKHGVLLIADNAHGAYLAFTKNVLHPIILGADICCDSAHKTLPVLTGGGYLHFSQSAPQFLVESAEKAMSVFASTSPSYLILQSLDSANRYLSDSYAEKLEKYVSALEKLKSDICGFGFSLCGNEPLKLTIAPKSYGYTGFEIAGILAENDIICEFSDPDYTVLMFTPENGFEIFDILKNVFSKIARRAPILDFPPKIVPAKRILSPKEAMLSESVQVPIDEAEGKILASAGVSCPPAIPIAVSGELIDENAVKLFRYYGIDSCDTVKQ